MFKNPINNWADLADAVANPEQLPELPPKPTPPPSRIIAEGGSAEFCEECGSSIKKSWFGKAKGCIQPLCDNYYLDQE